MLFNSLSFAFFLPVVFGLYWFVFQRNLRLQNALLLGASYFFYACWDVRFLGLLFFSTFLDYFAGLRMTAARSEKVRKGWLLLSITASLGLLGFFKYYNFFADSFADFLALLGFQASFPLMRFALPVGISFYTFHGLSYVIDIYRGRIKAEKNWVDYAVFVSFFPLLVAGPIERATHLLPQIKQRRQFCYAEAVSGLRQILWGLFKKVIIADGCAVYANMIFDPGESYSGSTRLLGAFFFAIQIYGDFSGYSDIAIGTGRLFGIRLLQNFAFPYFSRDIAEFWRRWHISLTSWFRDYLYVPLGGSRGPLWQQLRNVFIVFIVSGFWHGANWTFLAWGALNAVYFLPLLLAGTNRRHTGIVAAGKLLPSAREAGAMLFTFCLAMLAWVFFRADNMGHALAYLSGILSPSFFTKPEVVPIRLLLLIAFFGWIEWRGREGSYALETIDARWRAPVRYAFYYVLAILIFALAGGRQPFIYFQF